MRFDFPLTPILCKEKSDIHFLFAAFYLICWDSWICGLICHQILKIFAFIPSQIFISYSLTPVNSETPVSSLFHHLILSHRLLSFFNFFFNHFFYPGGLEPQSLLIVNDLWYLHSASNHPAATLCCAWWNFSQRICNCTFCKYLRTFTQSSSLTYIYLLPLQNSFPNSI